MDPTKPHLPIPQTTSKKKIKSPGWYRKNCDILFSQIVRSKGYCEWCGIQLLPKKLQCCHVISRTVLNLRYDPENAFSGCVKCHLYKWHKEPLQAAHWFEWQFPGRYERLKEKEKNTEKINWIETYERLKKEAPL